MNSSTYECFAHAKNLLFLVKTFSMVEAIEEGLVDGASNVEEVDETYEETKVQKSVGKMKRPKLAEYSMIRFIFVYIMSISCLLFE